MPRPRASGVVLLTLPRTSRSSGAFPTAPNVSTDRERYATGDEILVTLHVVNASAAPVTLEFQTAQRFDVSVADRAGSEIWRWSADRGFAQMLGAETVASGDTLTYSATYHGELPPGSYLAVGRLTARNRPLRAASLFAVERP